LKLGIAQYFRKPQERKKILIIIRDFTDNYDFVQTYSPIQDDLNRIWREMKKVQMILLILN